MRRFSMQAPNSSRFRPTPSNYTANTGSRSSAKIFLISLSRTATSTSRGIIAATALTKGYIVTTPDARSFPKIPGLSYQRWWTGFLQEIGPAPSPLIASNRRPQFTHQSVNPSPYFSRDGDRGEWGGRRSECRGAIKHGDGRQKKNFQSRVIDTGQLGLGASKFRFAGKSYPLARFRTRQISLR